MIYPKRHIAYLRYLIKHKWFVLQACREMEVPLWRGIIHDFSKFYPSEWLPYARNFFNRDGGRRSYKDRTGVDQDLFTRAWNMHQKRNKHHWQYWVLTKDDGGFESLPMPDVYVREMVADWIGAGLAITGKRDVTEWYMKNKDKMLLHDSTRLSVHIYLGLRFN